MTFTFMVISSDPLNDVLKVTHDNLNIKLNKHNLAALHPLKFDWYLTSYLTSIVILFGDGEHGSKAIETL